jgi:molybdopterin-containing oxidoreductase family membrane subunit
VKDALGRVDDDILGTLGPPGRALGAVFLLLLGVLALAAYAWAHQLRTGLGVAGYRPPIQWAVYITNFVFWVGIAHSGTLISAVLYLLRARWRTAVSRAAEAMTVFAVMTAGLFPIIHLGRPWLFYWLMPYPNQRQLWINFRSPLIWDVFAISTYLIVSALFLYVGLIPDLATARERSKQPLRTLYSLLALGWRGTAAQWRHYRALYGLLAAFATPLVVSVHSVVSWDFAMALLPGWHSTIFAPYFVAGAIFSGLAMVLTLLIPLRRLYRLEAYVTPWHFDNAAKLILVTSLIVSYAYVMEFVVAFTRAGPFERGTFLDRATGVYAPLFWAMVFCNCLLPLSLAFRAVRRSIPALFVISLLINVGMWLERFVIIVSSLAHDFQPSVWWGMYRPTWVELSITAGSFAWFLLWFLAFLRFFPPLPMSELKEASVHAAALDAPPRGAAA